MLAVRPVPEPERQDIPEEVVLVAAPEFRELSGGETSPDRLDDDRHAALGGLHRYLGDPIAIDCRDQRPLARAVADIQTGGILFDHVVDDRRNAVEIKYPIGTKRRERGRD